MKQACWLLRWSMVAGSGVWASLMMKSLKRRCGGPGKLDDQQFGFPIAAVLFAVQIHIRREVHAQLIARIKVLLVMMDLGGMDDLVAGFSKRQAFGLLCLWPVCKKLTAGPLTYPGEHVLM